MNTTPQRNQQHSSHMLALATLINLGWTLLRAPNQPVDRGAPLDDDSRTTLPLQAHSVATRLGRKNRPQGGFFISGSAWRLAGVALLGGRD